MTTELPVGTCHTCGKPHEGDYRPRHPYNDGTLGASETFGKRLASGDRTQPVTVTQQDGMTQSVGLQWPFDPVLRQALIDKGVITPDDLIEAEKKIRAVTSAVMGGQNDTATVPS